MFACPMFKIAGKLCEKFFKVILFNILPHFLYTSIYNILLSRKYILFIISLARNGLYVGVV